MTPVNCPNCKADLRQTATLSLYEITPADARPEVDAILECSACGRGWNAFVPVQTFLANPIVEGLT